MTASVRDTPHVHHGPLTVEMALAGQGTSSSTGVLRVMAPGHYHLAVRDLAVLRGLGASADWAWRARCFAERGEVVHVTHDDRHVISLGSVTAARSDRSVTGSRRIKLGSWSGAAAAIAAYDALLRPVLP